MNSKTIFTFFIAFFLSACIVNSNAQFNPNKLKKKVKSAVPVKTETTAKSKSSSSSSSSSSNNAAESNSSSTKTPSGKILHVAKTGSNKNDGSKNSPIKNIDKAIEISGPGDKIYIAEGIYMGKFNIGFLETDKAIKLYGSWDANFTKQDIINHPTVFQPDNASAGKSRKALLRFTDEVDGTVIDNIVWDSGVRNLYSPKDGIVEGVEGGMLRLPTEPMPGKNSTVGEPLISFLSKTKGGDVTVQNCVFTNGAMFGLQAGHRKGTFKVLNNVFVCNRMAAIEIYGTATGEADNSVEIAYNTILFTWSRLKDYLDMGYGIRIMTRANYNVHHNIVGTSIMGGICNNRFLGDQYLKLDNNILFGNKGGDIEYSPASNTELKLTVDQFEDLEFASVEGNIGTAPELPVNKAYLKGFFSARYNETLNYDPNSPQNQWARALGMNQQGTMSSKATMFMNKYPWKEALKLFGAKENYGAQIP